MTRILATTALCLTALATSANAGESARDPYRLLAERGLVRSLAAEARESCYRQADTQSPSRMVRAEPSFYGGLTPSSPFWPEVMAAYEEFTEVACSYQDPDGVEAEVIAEYRATMSPGEARETLAFLDSRAGKKMVAVQVAAQRWQQERMEKAYAESMRAASVDFTKRLQGILLRAVQEASPSCPAGDGVLPSAASL